MYSRIMFSCINFCVPKAECMNYLKGTVKDWFFGALSCVPVGLL